MSYQEDLLLMVDGMRTLSLGDKLLQNAIMRNLICNEAITRLDCKVVPSFQLLKKQFFCMQWDQVHQRLIIQEVKSNHAQLL